MEKYKRETGLRGETRQGRGDIKEERITNRHNDNKQAEVSSYKKEGENIGEGERNQMKKRNLKRKKLEEGKREIRQREGDTRRGKREIRRRDGQEIRRQPGKRNPAKVGLASREGNSQVPEAPTPIHGSPGSSKRYLQSNKTVFPF